MLIAARGRGRLELRHVSSPNCPGVSFFVALVEGNVTLVPFWRKRRNEGFLCLRLSDGTAIATAKTL
ncbi:MAG: hypothetical protein NBV65_05510 [Burkholderiaceae bacterium]|nr:hypothetical protein [Burkholderiaceae bacterium]